MNNQTFLAFSDELVKIAFYKRLAKGFMGAMKEGWHGTQANPQSWFGQGRQITPGMSSMGRRWEELSSLGGLTRALPVGNKSMLALGTYMGAREALRPEDPTGQQRSRAERVTSLAADTAGGLAGTAMALRLAPKSGIVAPILGGIVGSKLTRSVATAPFKAFRHPQQQQPMQPEQMPQQGVA